MNLALSERCYCLSFSAIEPEEAPCAETMDAADELSAK